MKAQVGIIMGSKSDLPIMQAAADVLIELGLDYDLTIISALKNKLIKEKSVFEPQPTAWDAISASIITLHT